MARLDERTCRDRVRAARVGRLATADAGGAPHIVPVTFAVIGGPVGTELVSAIDHKPKSTAALRRLRNLAANPRAALLVDHYGEDWTRLWWVRADGHVVVDQHGPAWAVAIDALVEKYRQYADRRPDGPVIRLRVERWSGWAYQDG
ncbi:TIGR03668 family PPOX class F420-dependent oxidoreductase [Georgenia halophila]|uniref:TIGR03668 family PPOX class F420-dependent oxidoreductase n=1 Tax=Georgenia halophila TaxID=620889 RepID=A0ABP8L4S9_9MICO